MKMREESILIIGRDEVERKVYILIQMERCGHENMWKYCILPAHVAWYPELRRNTLAW